MWGPYIPPGPSHTRAAAKGCVPREKKVWGKEGGGREGVPGEKCLVGASSVGV